MKRLIIRFKCEDDALDWQWLEWLGFRLVCANGYLNGWEWAPLSSFSLYRKKASK